MIASQLHARHPTPVAQNGIENFFGTHGPAFRVLREGWGISAVGEQKQRPVFPKTGEERKAGPGHAVDVVLQTACRPN